MDLSEPAAARIEDPTELAHERYSALVRAVATVVWTATRDGSTRVGSDWTALTAQTPAEMAGYGWLDAIHPDDRERTRDAWRTAVTHQGVYDTDYRIRCVDGVYRWFNARGAPVLDRDGSIREWVGMCLAITGSKRFQVDMTSSVPSRDQLGAGQVRAARALLGWTIERLSREADLSPSTVARIEDDGRISSVRQSNLDAARTAFQAAGIVFTWDASGAGGLCLRASPPTS
jgi:PAS domain S-box-containing protein